ncbi:hypothetical protein F5Y00DRAFT_64912 [Daldinia vernicosa]|uniref:uncharacterized protein n=1 Tax=Daldinia vernicosa TaxID=114800 RepID=UPI002007C867|nr:uncharacterized protein F5Y00DRAFT_64912 [Daldinia vernicosa]KAI0854024.1 hypothetical protein F5Y00DRAFT_64912 [Daldinia vernicosa]
MMGVMIPEILCLICSHLDIEDIRRFRLCCKAFADAGACFAFREIIFYLHPHDFDMLRHISLHPIASKNVRSLIYVGHTLESPKKSWDEFQKYYSDIRSVEKIIAQHANETPPPRIGNQQLLRLYKNYEVAIDEQEKMLNNKEDISCLKEVISRFSSLQEITMSTQFEFGRGTRKTPFEGCLVKPGDELTPMGCRQLDSLLSAVFEADIKLRRLTAGTFSWQFFQKPAVELRHTLSFSSNLTCLELCIDTGEEYFRVGVAEDVLGGTEVPQCRHLLETGLLRDFIKSLSQLQTLSVVFNWHSDEHGYAARLEDIMEPKHRWEHLDSLTLGNITCERHDLMSMLRRHKGTLKALCLRDIRLRSTSWRLLLPKIRKTMNLDEACICGELYGQEEDSPYEEYWDLALPDTFEDVLRDDVNDYLVNDNIRRCPLND